MDIDPNILNYWKVSSFKIKEDEDLNNFEDGTLTEIAAAAYLEYKLSTIRIF